MKKILHIIVASTLLVGISTPVFAVGLPLCSLRTNKTVYYYGESITISWTSTDTTYTAFQQDTSAREHIWLPADKLGTSGSQTVTASLLGYSTFVLVAYNATGSQSCSAPPISVIMPAATPTVSLNVYPSMVTAGQSALLKWETGNATRCVLKYGPSNGTIYGPHEETVGVNGSKTVSPPQTYTYYLWCMNDRGDGKDGPTASQASVLSVSVATAATPSISFSASPSSISAGQNATLLWNTSNTQRCVLQYGSYQENVAVNGSKVVSPAQTTAYKLWCANDPGTGKDGPSASKTVSVSVSGQSSGLPADVDPEPSSSCISLSNNLRYRSRDAQTNGEVSLLQDFLQSKGYLKADPTGYFGLLTLSAVKQFQSASSISATGYVGPITRARITASTCQ